MFYPSSGFPNESGSESIRGIAALNIQAIARRTGVPAATLRKWEQRYGVLRPERTAGSHRRYSERDVLRAEWVEAPGVADVLELWIEADSFMRHMVRTLVGTMLDVAGGRRPEEDFEWLLGGVHRREASDTAAPDGLYLESVRYR